MFRQLVTPVADNLALSFQAAPRTPRDRAASRLAGVHRRRPGRVGPGGDGVAVAGGVGAEQHLRGRDVRGVAGDVDRAQRAASIQHRGGHRQFRCVPCLDGPASAQRSAGGAGRGRVLVRVPAGGRRRVRHPDRDHQRASGRARLSRDRSDRLHPHVQHRTRRVRRARLADHHAGGRDATERRRARCDGGQAAAVDRPVSPLLRDRGLWRHESTPRRMAGPASGGWIVCGSSAMR
jgi:hypothetical protein